MTDLSPFRQRMLALLLLAAAVLLFTFGVALPIMAGYSARAAERERLAATFQLNERRIASLPALANAAAREADQLRAQVIAAPNADEAGELLREQLETAAMAVGADIKSTDSAGADNGEVRAMLQAQMSHAQIEALLNRLNTIRPYVVIESISLVAEDALVHFNSDQIDVRIEVSAPFVPA
jgi:Tfp pilus assembly protein PilO